jgi:hypothetical protein
VAQEKQMRWVALIGVLSVLVALAACHEPAQPKPAEARAKATAPAVPGEVANVAETLLGSQAEVLVFGDLAHTGSEQALVVNRLAKTPPGMAPGLLITRAVIAEKADGKWTEVFRCDEHLKNPNGFLGATPIAPVTGWRLQYEQNSAKGLVMYFTPLEMPGSTHIPTIGVRWNPQGKRYQSLGRNYEQFLSEVPALEKINSRLR